MEEGAVSEREISSAEFALVSGHVILPFVGHKDFSLSLLSTVRAQSNTDFVSKCTWTCCRLGIYMYISVDSIQRLLLLSRLPTLPHSLLFHPHSLPHSLTPSLPHSLPHSLTPTLPHSLSHSLTHTLPSSLTHSLTPSLPPPSGISLWDTVVSNILSRRSNRHVDLLQYYNPLTLPVHAVYVFLLLLVTVSLLDR